MAPCPCLVVVADERRVAPRAPAVVEFGGIRRPVRSIRRSEGLRVDLERPAVAPLDFAGNDQLRDVVDEAPRHFPAEGSVEGRVQHEGVPEEVCTVVHDAEGLARVESHDGKEALRFRLRCPGFFIAQPIDPLDDFANLTQIEGLDLSKQAELFCIQAVTCA